MGLSLIPGYNMRSIIGKVWETHTSITHIWTVGLEISLHPSIQYTPIYFHCWFPANVSPVRWASVHQFERDLSNYRITGQTSHHIPMYSPILSIGGIPIALTAPTSTLSEPPPMKLRREHLGLKQRSQGSQDIGTPSPGKKGVYLRGFEYGLLYDFDTGMSIFFIYLWDLWL